MGVRLVASRRWPKRVRRVPHQVTLVARCLVEAACVRTARRVGPDAAIVILSASEALHGLSGLLGGRHIRFVHEVVTTEDSPLRLVGHLARCGEARVLALAPTEQVRAELTSAFPRLPCDVRAFAVADPRDRLTESESRTSRIAMVVPHDAVVVCLVGGWWPYKDLDVIDAALVRLTRPMHMLVLGHPLDQRTLARWRSLPQVHLHVFSGPATEAQVRAVYAAATASVVARRPGIGKESGLVIDSLRLGVPLISSTHNPDLTARLGGQPWARLFTTGDPQALADVLDDLAANPPARPDTHAPALFGVPTAAEQVAFLISLHA
jgi:glycosyltransferase involved in cell wall biosynthesis